MNTATDIQQDSTIVSMVNQGLRVALLPRLAAVQNNDTVQMYSLPVPLDRIMGVVVLSSALPIPAVFTFLEMLRKFDFQRLAESTY